MLGSRNIVATTGKSRRATLQSTALSKIASLDDQAIPMLISWYPLHFASAVHKRGSSMRQPRCRNYAFGPRVRLPCGQSEMKITIAHIICKLSGWNGWVEHPSSIKHDLSWPGLSAAVTRAKKTCTQSVVMISSGQFSCYQVVAGT